MEEELIKCPKCGSTQITASKKGYSAAKGIGTALLTGGIGLVAGFHGAGKVKLICLKCGNSWKPGSTDKQESTVKQVTSLTPKEKWEQVKMEEANLTPEQQKKNQAQNLGCLVVLLAIAIVIIWLLLK